MTEKNKTFIKITNQDIYEKLCDIEDHVLITNGKVKINTIMSRIAMTLIVLVISALLGATII